MGALGALMVGAAVWTMAAGGRARAGDECPQGCLDDGAVAAEALRVCRAAPAPAGDNLEVRVFPPGQGSRPPVWWAEVSAPDDAYVGTLCWLGAPRRLIMASFVPDPVTGPQRAPLAAERAAEEGWQQVTRLGAHVGRRTWRLCEPPRASRYLWTMRFVSGRRMLYVAVDRFTGRLAMYRDERGWDAFGGARCRAISAPLPAR